MSSPTLSPETRSLLMRANRLLGANLVEQNLVNIDQLENANEKLLEVLGNNDARQSTLLGILAYDMKVIREEDVLQHAVDEFGLGLIDLRNYEVADEFRKSIELAVCWATWSIPFDREEDFVSIATAYYHSPAIRVYWEKQYGKNILWYGTTLDEVAEYLEKLDADRVAGIKP